MTTHNDVLADLDTLRWHHLAEGLDPAAMPYTYRKACWARNHALATWIIETFPCQRKTIGREVVSRIYGPPDLNETDKAWLKSNAFFTPQDVVSVCDPMFLNACAAGLIQEAQRLRTAYHPTWAVMRAALTDARRRKFYPNIIKWLESIVPL